MMALKVTSNQTVSRPSLAVTIIRAPRQKAHGTQVSCLYHWGWRRSQKWEQVNRAWGWGPSDSCAPSSWIIREEKSFNFELWVVLTAGNIRPVEPLDPGKVAACKVLMTSHRCEFGASLRTWSPEEQAEELYFLNHWLSGRHSLIHTRHPGESLSQVPHARKFLSLSPFPGGSDWQRGHSLQVFTGAFGLTSSFFFLL